MKFKYFKYIVLSIVSILLGFVLPAVGGTLNRVAKKANYGVMPVWCVDRQTFIAVFGSNTHGPLTNETRYKALTDIIPVPYYWNGHFGIYAMYSIGDILLESGDALLFWGTLGFFFWIVLCLPWTLLRLAWVRPKCGDDPNLSECPFPPDGWRCTRESGHDGPCAAVPISEVLMHRPEEIFPESGFSEDGK